MPRIEATTQIDASPERVWALMCDTTRYPEWVVPTDRVLDPGTGEMREGFEYREYGGIPPFKGETQWREPHHRQVHVGDDGSMTMRLVITLTPEGNGTRLQQTIDLQPRWWLRPINLVLWPLMMRKRGQAAMDQTTANAKRLLESASA